MTQERNERSLQFTFLPSFTDFLLQHIDEYTKEFVRLVYEVNLPLLKSLQHLTEEEKFQFSKRLNTEFLTNMSHNNAKGHLEAVTSRWLTDQVENIRKTDVHAQDITMINYVRSKALKHFINTYTSDPELTYRLHSEIDDLAFAYNTKSTNDYLQVLNDKIEQESHFSRNIIEAIPGTIFIYDLIEQKTIYINGRVKEVIGYTPEEVLSIKNSVSQLMHPEDMPAFIDFINAVIEEKEGKVHHVDYRLKSRSLDYHWMRSYAVVYKRDSNEKATQLLGMDFDISVEKETSIALQKREKQLLEAQSLGKIGSFEWDTVKDSYISSPELRKIFETDQRQQYDEWMQNVHCDDVEKVQKALAEAFISGTYQCEFRYLAPSREKVIDSKGIVTFGEDRKPLTLTGTIQDITERKKIEESLIQNTIELEHSNTQLQEFAYVASHDLKEPLRKIGMFSNIIMTTDWDLLPEKTKNNLQKISDSATRMQKLIDGILSYSSINAEQDKVHCSLEGLLQDALNNLEYLLNETGAVVLSDGLPDAVVVPFQMQQLFQNLIGNALKFSKKLEKPEVKVSHSFVAAEEVPIKGLKQGRHYLKIAVTDNGIGFNEESAEKIFGLFQRLHGRHDYEGSGVGLAISKRIVERHEGVITASSKIGEGATFTFFLPAG